MNFIVRAVDDVLKTEFGLADGLADTSKVTVDWDTGQDDRRGKRITVPKEVHRVQILDPATGTGTFLAEVVRLIAERVKIGASGKWSGYVDQDLLPRLHGFELLMASYAMCHLKLDLMLNQTGYKPRPVSPRLSVWLTNALEPGNREIRDLFMPEMVEEARGASEVKRQTPIMCIVGNPPYSGESANKGKYIMDLMEAYKMEPGGKQRLKERNSKWINDDYVKFIRMSEKLISENESGGVLGFITNHGYLDNPTFRGMRWHLLKTFDKIWILDLHGNAKKKETAPDGTADVNVFDIQQGVAIIIAAKTGGVRDELAKVYHGDLWGERAKKNETLWNFDRNFLATEILEHRATDFPFENQNFEGRETYDKGFELVRLFPFFTMGMITKRDAFTIDFDRESMWSKVVGFANTPLARVHETFDLPADSDWTAKNAQDDVRQTGPSRKLLANLNYAPFDQRWTYYTGTTRGFFARPVYETMRHLRDGNFALSVTRKLDIADSWRHGFCVDEKMTHHAVSMKEGNNVLPLYLLPEENSLDQSVRLNLEPKLYAELCKAARLDPKITAMALGSNLSFDFRVATGDDRPSEIKVFDYIYGVLHSPDYRSKFAEFLKVDFPRIPYPPSPEAFAHVSERGEALRRLHLMEDAAIGDAPYPFLGEGDDVVASGYPKWEADKVFINPDQHFDAVPKRSWEFHIGGYQPAQKWLKDRRGRALSYDDVRHYQKIVKILIETDRIMGEIELPLD